MAFRLFCIVIYTFLFTAPSVVVAAAVFFSSNIFLSFLQRLGFAKSFTYTCTFDAIAFGERKLCFIAAAEDEIDVLAEEKQKNHRNCT